MRALASASTWLKFVHCLHIPAGMVVVPCGCVRRFASAQRLCVHGNRRCASVVWFRVCFGGSGSTAGIVIVPVVVMIAWSFGSFRRLARGFGSCSAVLCFGLVMCRTWAATAADITLCMLMVLSRRSTGSAVAYHTMVVRVFRYVVVLLFVFGLGRRMTGNSGCSSGTVVSRLW